MLSRENELLMAALQIERIYEPAALRLWHDARRIFLDLAEEEVAALWHEIGRRFDELNPA